VRHPVDSSVLQGVQRPLLEDVLHGVGGVQVGRFVEKEPLLGPML
jgi:hypothetical protein